MSDAFEYQSAIDLNSGVGSLPYPGKRPYPNPLFADPETDYDGDGLTRRPGVRAVALRRAASLPLSYSAGLKRTVGPLDDDERDGDADGLGNWVEFNGPMTPKWWSKEYKQEKPYTETYSGPSAIDPDSDGDGVLDGADDQDFDDWSNARGSRARPVPASSRSTPACRTTTRGRARSTSRSRTSYPPFDCRCRPAAAGRRSPGP